MHSPVQTRFFCDGAKYKNTFKDYFGDIRGISNEVSRAHGLSVIEPGEGGRHYAEWDAEAQGRPTLRALVRQDIDAAIANAYTMKTFWQRLEELGYTVKRGANVKHTAVKLPGGQRFFRLDGLGSGYTEADIQARLSAVRSGEAPPPLSPGPSFCPILQPLTPGRRYQARGGISGRPRKLKGFAPCTSSTCIARGPSGTTPPNGGTVAPGRRLSNLNAISSNFNSDEKSH